jgi:hypothetical protein
VLSQQPLLHEALPHGCPPLEEPPPEEPPDEGPLAQAPPWHVWWLIVQSKHDWAALPHWVSMLPAWQLLFESQQPLHDDVQGTPPEPLLPESFPPELPPLDELLLEPPEELADPLDEDAEAPLLPPAKFPESSAATPPELAPGNPPPSRPGTTTPPVAHPASANERYTSRDGIRIRTPASRRARRRPYNR